MASVNRIFDILGSVPHHFVEIAGELRGVFFNGKTVAQRKGNDQACNRQPGGGRYGQQGKDQRKVENDCLAFADLDTGTLEEGKPVVSTVDAHGTTPPVCWGSLYGARISYGCQKCLRECFRFDENWMKRR